MFNFKDLNSLNSRDEFLMALFAGFTPLTVLGALLF
jgi:hypothetical protein